MKKILTLLIVFLLSNAEMYSTSFSANASLFEHMYEVNKEWVHHNDILTHQTVAFENENERIKTHLLYVIDYLRENFDPQLSIEQHTLRTEALEGLEAYALRMMFPKNINHNARTPYFIDHENTACAVGQMLRNTGHDHIGQWVKSEMNNAYVADIPKGDLDLWAEDYGFTRSELAWIQPGYNPSLDGWSSMQQGVNGPAKTLIEFNGDLIIAGNFSDASGLSVNNVVSWDGTNFIALGDGVNGWVNCSIIFEGDLLLGGSFNGGFDDIAIWDGTSWSYRSAFSSKFAETTSIGIYLDKLYVGGTASGFAGIDYILAIWEDPSWNWIAEFEGGEIKSIVQYGDELLVGGNFNSVNIFGDIVDASNIALLTEQGVWEEFNGGVDGYVNDIIITSENEVIVAGSIVQGIDYKFGLAISNAGGWQPLITEGAFNSNFLNPSPFGHFNKMLINGMDTLLCGEFSTSFGMETGSSMASLQTIGNYATGKPFFSTDGEIFDMFYADDILYVAGDFDQLTGVDFFNIAQFGGPNAIPEIDKNAYNIYPIPAKDNVFVDLLEFDHHGWSNVFLVDLQGKKIEVPFEQSGNGIDVNLNGVSSGQYLLHVSGTNGQLTEKIVVVK